MATAIATGQKYEALAADYLKSENYEIIEMNFHGRHGEIDIIAKDGKYLVFIEGKYRKSSVKGMPFEAVDKNKQKRIRQTALYYMIKNKYSCETPCRFDVVSILGHTVTLFKNAF